MTGQFLCFHVFLKCSNVSYMHHYIYNYLQENKYFILNNWLTIIQLVGQIDEDFEKNKYALVVFIDLAKAFDKVWPQNTIKKNGNLRCRWNYEWFEKWFENYLTKRKTINSDKQYQKHSFKGCCMWSSLRINIRSSFIFDICKQPTIYFKLVRSHYVRW